MKRHVSIWGVVSLSHTHSCLNSTNMSELYYLAPNDFSTFIMESYFLMRWRLFYLYHGKLLFDEMSIFLPLSWRVTFWWDVDFSTFIMESYFIMKWQLFYLYHGELLYYEMTTFLPLSWRVTFWWDDNFSTFIMESYFLMRWQLFYLYHGVTFDEMTTFLPLS